MLKKYRKLLYHNTVVLDTHSWILSNRVGFFTNLSVPKSFIFSIVVTLPYNLKIESKKVILKKEVNSQMVTIQIINAFLDLK